jgi:formylglycine-generating enzyme required for sulfatase activity
MAYVYLTRAETNPEYVDNEDYSNPLQPIIGVSLKDAQAYAEWLSAQLECTFRLPVEEEWEKAARGGAQFIYPWGDDDPKKDKNANFKGNGLFNGPSPVGSYENGNNGLGLVDMSGNVWEWTTSNKNEKEENDLRTVKGGSWMDGPADLRISNYKNVDLNTGYPDVGFRLVKEVSK